MSSSENQQRINQALQLMCQSRVGVLDSNFLCQSLSVVNPREPVCIPASTPLREVAGVLAKEQVGCLLVTDNERRVSGIFSERDWILKISLREVSLVDSPISQHMTKDPVCAEMDTTLAFALNLMSHGGFRHLPIVDSERRAVGVVSVKDIIDHIVARMTEDLLSFEVGIGT